MGNKRSTCLYLDKKVVETARRLGLNLSRVSENALIEVIRRLSDPKTETSLCSSPDLEGRGRDLNPGARLHRPGNNDRDEWLSGFYDLCRVDLGTNRGNCQGVQEEDEALLPSH